MGIKPRSVILLICQIVIFQASWVWAQGSPTRSSPVAQSLEIPTPRGSKIEITPPSTQDFFKRGNKIFPSSFQASGSELVNRANSSPADASKDYPVGPGDQFLINFWGRIEDNLIVQINTDEKLFIPRVGVVDTAGLRYEELQERVTEKLNASLKNVSFTISLYKQREFQVFVLGAVNKPGPIRANSNFRASQVIESAGGVAATGSMQFIELRRKGQTFNVDLLNYLNSANFANNPFVTNDDILFVPNLTDFVTIRGAIVRPGTFEIKETKQLDSVISLLGGYSVYADKTTPIRISRTDSSGARVQLKVYQNRAAAEANKGYFIETMALENGDEVFIPSSNLLIPSKSNSVFVTGEVKSPGMKPYSISMSVDEYIGSAGGLTSRADMANAVVYKTDGSTVQLEPRIAIEPGDTIFVPEKTFKFWQDHLAIITTFISLATSIIVLSGR